MGFRFALPAGGRAGRRYRNLFDDLNSEAFESHYPAGMIGEQANRAQLQVRKNLRADARLMLRPSLVGRFALLR